MNIYLYGSKKFKKSMTDLMQEANLNEITNDIEDIDELETVIANKPNEIYLIDSDKIIKRNIITDKLNFLKPQGSVYKEYLEEVGIDDMCFNSNEALINYIIDKIDSNDYNEVEKDIDNNIDINENTISSVSEFTEDIIEERRTDDIMDLDDIFENEMADALSIDISDLEKAAPIKQAKSEEAIENNTIDNIPKIDENTNKVEINTSNVSDVMHLIKELLNNKTLELSIKIKDS